MQKKVQLPSRRDVIAKILLKANGITLDEISNQVAKQIGIAPSIAQTKKYVSFAVSLHVIKEKEDK